MKKEDVSNYNKELETKSNMYDENYPQKWNDVRLYNEIIEILSHQ